MISSVYLSAIPCGRAGPVVDHCRAGEDGSLGESPHRNAGGAGFGAYRSRADDDSNQADRRTRSITRQRSVLPYHIAKIYAAGGNKEKCFAWLEKAYEEGNPDLIVRAGIRWPARRRAIFRLDATSRLEEEPGNTGLSQVRFRKYHLFCVYFSLRSTSLAPLMNSILANRAEVFR